MYQPRPILRRVHMTDVGRTLVRTDYVKLYIKLWFLSFLHLTSFFFLAGSHHIRSYMKLVRQRQLKITLSLLQSTSQWSSVLLRPSVTQWYFRRILLLVFQIIIHRKTSSKPLFALKWGNVWKQQQQALKLFWPKIRLKWGSVNNNKQDL